MPTEQVDMMAGAAADRRNIPPSTRCSGCRRWCSTTAPSSPNRSRSAAISRRSSPTRRCSARGALETAMVEMWNRRCEINLLLAVANVFRHLHPADQDAGGAAGAGLGRGQQAARARIPENPRRPAWQAPLRGRRHYSVADITALCAVDFLKPASIDAARPSSPT